MLGYGVVQLIGWNECPVLLSVQDAQHQFSEVRRDEVSAIGDLHAELSNQDEAFFLYTSSQCHELFGVQFDFFLLLRFSFLLFLLIADLCGLLGDLRLSNQ